MQTVVKMMNTYVEGCVNWLLPAKVNFTAMPIALIDMTDTDPTVEQIEMKIRGFFFPYIGATRYIMTTAKTATAKQKMRNPSSPVSMSSLKICHRSHTWPNRIVQNLVDRLNIFVRRRM